MGDVGAGGGGVLAEHRLDVGRDRDVVGRIEADHGDRDAVARTAATASGSTPKFHSTMSDGEVVSMSMLPGASIVPPIVWIPARFVANAGSFCQGVLEVRPRAEGHDREPVAGRLRLGSEAGQELRRRLAGPR